MVRCLDWCPVCNVTLTLFFFLFSVVTGATDGIGKSYAEEVRAALEIKTLLASKLIIMVLPP